MAWTRKGAAATAQASWLAPLPVWFSEITTNDSDKSFAVGSDSEDAALWVVRIRLELTTTATAGNRLLAIEVQDETSDQVYHLYADDTAGEGTVAASTSVALEFCAGAQRVAPQSSGASIQFLPDHLLLYPGYTLRVYDTAAVDAAADDMVLHMACLKVG